MILLDTNIISELRKARPHGGVIAWYSQQPSSTLFLSAITIYELQSGAERTRITDKAKARDLDEWILGLQERFGVVAFTATEARLTASLMRRISLDHLEDGMIAATAIAQRLTVATRNTRDFEPFNIPIINPFQFR